MLAVRRVLNGVGTARCALPGNAFKHMAIRGFSYTPDVSYDNTRNIGIIAHIDAGKTTTTERFLYFSGQTRSMGEVHDGDTVMDFMKLERERGITIGAAATRFLWNNHEINLVDTPGHVDFTVEVERTLRVMDGAVVILDAVAGVESQTETVWQQANRYEIPRIVFVNKMDRDGADFNSAVEQMKQKLDVVPLVAQIPMVGTDKDVGLLDVVTMEAVSFTGEDENTMIHRSTEVPSSQLEMMVNGRRQLVETLADVDESVFDAFMENDDGSCLETFTPEMLVSAMRRAVISSKGNVVVTLAGSAFQSRGVQNLLDGIVNYLPAPSEKPPVVLTKKGNKQEVPVKYSPNEDLVALAFKVTHDNQRNPLVYIRVYSGVLRARSALFNATQHVKEKVGRAAVVSADDIQDVDGIPSGGIGVLTGLKHTRTGDTLLGGTMKEQMTLEGIEVMEPVFTCALILEDSSSEKALKESLACICREDPTVQVHVDKETGQTLLSGMGELHLEVVNHKLTSEYKLPVTFGDVRVAYREAITSHGTSSVSLAEDVPSSEFIKGGTGLTMRVEVAPTSELEEGALVASNAGNSVQFADELEVLGRDAKKHIREGISSALQQGTLLGFQTMGINVQVSEIEGWQNAPAMALSMCSAVAVSKAIANSFPVLIEPVMDVDVSIADEHVGAVTADLSSSRRGQVRGINDSFGGRRLVQAKVPLKELMGYSTALRSLTRGAGSFSMSVGGYAIMDKQAQRAAMKEIRGFDMDDF